MIAGHLVSASVIWIPAAAVVSKLMLPETEQPVTLGHVPHERVGDPQPNTIAALIGCSVSRDRTCPRPHSPR